jgi:hypothetical protein
MNRRRGGGLLPWIGESLSASGPAGQPRIPKVIAVATLRAAVRLISL